MSKDELIKLLKEYKENKSKLSIRLKELKNARIRLKNISEYDTNMTASYGENRDIHSKNKIGNKVLDKVEQNDNKRLEIEAEIEELEKTIRQLREKVEAVDDRITSLKYKEREILTAYYVEGRTAEDIGNNLYFQLFNQTRSGRQIQNIVEKATENILKL